MSNLTDATDTAATNAHTDSSAVVAGSTAPGSHAAKVLSPTSGTAFQVDAVRDADLYISINTAAALAIAMGPTSAVATTISASQSDALGVVCLHVPGGWFVKLTGTMANLTVTSILK